MDFRTYLPYLVNRVGSRFVTELSPTLNSAGIDVQMWRVLIALFQQGSQPTGVLSEDTSINLSTLSRLVGRMQDKGLVTRTRGDDDARSVIVELTTKGKATTKKVLPIATALEAEATTDFTEAELKTLRRLLVKLYEKFPNEMA